MQNWIICHLVIVKKDSGSTLVAVSKLIEWELKTYTNIVKKEKKRNNVMFYLRLFHSKDWLDDRWRKTGARLVRRAEVELRSREPETVCRCRTPPRSRRQTW